MSPQRRLHRYDTTDLIEAESTEWDHLRKFVRLKSGRREVRAGRSRFTSSEIIKMLSFDPHDRAGDRAIIEGAMHGKQPLNPVSLSRWLKDRLLDAPTNGLALRSAKDRMKRECFWIERHRDRLP